MKAYFMFDTHEVLDPHALEAYAREVPPLVAKFGGRYLAVGGPVEPVEGTWRPSFPVLLEFPSVAQAKAWYDSDEYRSLRARRHTAARSHAVLIAGTPG